MYVVVDRDELKPGDYGVCYSCSARTVDRITYEVGCNKKIFSTTSSSGGTYKEPLNCPFPSTSTKPQKETTLASINYQLKQILGKQ